jgi:hypothetical protein
MWTLPWLKNLDMQPKKLGGGKFINKSEESYLAKKDEDTSEEVMPTKKTQPTNQKTNKQKTLHI